MRAYRLKHCDNIYYFVLYIRYLWFGFGSGRYVFYDSLIGLALTCDQVDEIRIIKDKGRPSLALASDPDVT